MDFMKDNLWAYANAVSTVCVADDESCENIRTVLDQLETERDIESFVQEYGTGSSIPNPPEFAPFSGNVDGSSSTASLVGNNNSSTANSSHPARFIRKSRKPAPAPPYAANGAAPAPPSTAVPPTPTQNTHERSDSFTTSRTASQRTASPPTQQPIMASPPRANPPPSSPPTVYQQPPSQQPTRNASGNNGYAEAEAQARAAAIAERRMTLPQQPAGIEVAAPVPPMPQPASTGTGERNKILFYVEAMYDYTATIDEEFNFQAGDIIAVTDIPPDGWWSGELLDEARREEGRHVFPSNFVRLF